MYKNIFIILYLFLASCTITQVKEKDPVKALTISNTHPAYWSYKGENVLLLGGSVEDNLFQIPELEKELILLKEVGGNYVRNTMSSRDEGNVWPFKKTGNELYDLNQWNEEYWNRFDNFLLQTHESEIFVQIELWATFDFYRNNWDLNPFNPKNNINYNNRRSKLSDTVTTHPVFTENNFFRSVPSQMAIAPVLQYQQKFVDKLLSLSLEYDHILYCMDNETSVTSDWGKFWSRYIQKKAKEKGKIIHTTEMWDPHDLSHPFHAETFDNPEIFSFVDISQNNHKSSDEHWENGLTQLRRLEQTGAIRPANNVKIYGNDGGRHKTTRDGIENFIQNVFMGCASARFHRPTSGQGLNETAQSVIRAIRDLSDKMDFFNGSASNHLLQDRGTGEAYCRAIENKEYAIYFPDGGSVDIDLNNFQGKPGIQWLNVLGNDWTSRSELDKDMISVQAPGEGHWIALIN
ncbi:MAG: hypothetical protein ACP5E3_02085 [Bacteroidales bacterium]